MTGTTRTTKFLVLLASAAVFATASGCEESSDDNTAALALAALAASAGGSGDTVAAANVRTAASGSSSEIASQVSGGGISFNSFLPENRARLAQQMHAHGLKDVLAGRAIPTVATVSGGSCNTTNCSGTVSGSINCTRGGTITFNNTQITVTGVAIVGTAFSFSSSIDGSMTAANCQILQPDWINFPGQRGVNMSGTFTMSGTSNFGVSNASNDGSTYNQTITVAEDYTVNSDSLAFDGAAGVAVNALRSQMSLTVQNTTSNIQTSTNGSVTTFSANYSDVITGTVSTSGTVGGASAATSRTFTGQTFNYSVTCTLDSSNNTASCTTTQS